MARIFEKFTYKNIGIGVLSLAILVSIFFAIRSLLSPKPVPDIPKRDITFPDTAVNLNTANIDNFIKWASRSTLNELSSVIEKIHQARDDTEVAVALRNRFEDSRFNDFSQALVLLGIIGELRDPSSIEWLDGIIWESLPPPRPAPHGGLSPRELGEIIRSKAVEVLIYHKSPLSDSLTIRVVQLHPSRAVRAAAINAYLFNHEDSIEAKERLREIVRSEDQIFIDRIRLTANVDPDDFDRRVKEFDEKYNRRATKPVTPGKNQGKIRNVILDLSVALLLLYIVQLILLIFGILKPKRLHKNQERVQK